MPCCALIDVLPVLVFKYIHKTNELTEEATSESQVFDTERYAESAMVASQFACSPAGLLPGAIGKEI
jgi:hypothetical protein